MDVFYYLVEVTELEKLKPRYLKGKIEHENSKGCIWVAMFLNCNALRRQILLRLIDICVLVFAENITIGVQGYGNIRVT